MAASIAILVPLLSERARCNQDVTPVNITSTP